MLVVVVLVDVFSAVAVGLGGGGRRDAKAARETESDDCLMWCQQPFMAMRLLAPLLTVLL